ncbi:MAG TPA: 3-hydroxybutyryl-CoA dehydrogenase [Acidimicrobiia bacterium]|nr:3-hydroxybutyryl-CoA dehydrogenase [Acidimicrobiia bacterium]
MSSIERLGVVGAGQMGGGIVEVAMRAGVDVVMVDVSEEAVNAGEMRLRSSLDRAVDRGKATAEERDAALAMLTTATDLDALADRQLVIEAVIENESIKAEVFGRLDHLLDGEAILASNTSSIPIVTLARSTRRIDRFVGMHFFNPVPVMKLVEIIPAVTTSDETVAAAKAFGERLGKTAIVAPDRAGFVVNALLVPYLLDAIRFYEAGNATKEDIDTGMQLGAAHPMGPLTLCDLIGNDVMLMVAESLYDEFRETRMAPPPLLRRMVSAGLLGRKTGEGFYRY